MTKPQETDKIVVFYFKCPECGMVIAGLSRQQVEYNAQQHLYRHGIYERIALPPNHKVIKLE